MKKRCFVGLVCLAFSLLLSACGITDAPTASGDPAPSERAVQSAPPASSQPADETAAQSPFTPGVWLSDGGQYYFFDEGGETGSTLSLDSGTGVGFTYVLDGEGATFYLGAADNASPCTVSREGEALVLAWEDGAAETLTYVSDQGADSFRFYSNQELCDMALAYYQAQAGEEAGDGLTAAAQTNEDGSVTIQVYQNLGDHNSTAAWYTVDRFTGAGTDGVGDPVDLTA